MTTTKTTTATAQAQGTELPMSYAAIVKEYRESKDKGKQIKILADENLCSVKKIQRIIIREGAWIGGLPKWYREEYYAAKGKPDLDGDGDGAVEEEASGTEVNPVSAERIGNAYGTAENEASADDVEGLKRSVNHFLSANRELQTHIDDLDSYISDLEKQLEDAKIKAVNDDTVFDSLSEEYANMEDALAGYDKEVRALSHENDEFRQENEALKNLVRQKTDRITEILEGKKTVEVTITPDGGITVGGVTMYFDNTEAERCAAVKSEE